MNSEDGNFEEPIVRLRRRIEELSALPDDAAHRREIEKLREKLERVSREIYANLTPWQKTLVARHPGRPYPLDYIEALTTEFVELQQQAVASLAGLDARASKRFDAFGARYVAFDKEG